MPVAGYQVMMTWNAAGLAVNESHVWAGPADDALSVVYPAALDLMKKRSLMMGAGVVPVRFRISKLGVFRFYLNSRPQDVGTMAVGAAVVATNQPPALTAAGVSNPQDGSSDQAPAAILMDAYNTPQTHGRVFLAGCPDVLIRTNPVGPWLVGVASWGVAFDAYRALLISPATKWAFQARIPATVANYEPKQVTRLVLDVNSGLISVQCPTFAPPVAVGQKLQVRLFKMYNPGYKNFGGIFQINSINEGSEVGTSLYELRNTSQFVYNQIDKLGTVQRVDYDVFRYVECYPTKDTTHKRGNRSLASPGRRRTVRRVTA